MPKNFYTGKAELNVSHNRYKLIQEPPLYTNVIIEPFQLKVYLTDQGGGVHNGETQEIKITLENESKVHWQPTAATILYPSYDKNTFNSNSQNAQINQVFSLSNSKLNYAGKPNVLCNNSRSSFNTKINIDDHSELSYLEFFSTGRIAHDEQWQFNCLAMNMQFYKNSKLKFSENWAIDNLTAFPSSLLNSVGGFQNCEQFCTGLYSGKSAREEANIAIKQLQQSSNSNQQHHFHIVEIEPELYLLRGLMGVGN